MKQHFQRTLSLLIFSLLSACGGDSPTEAQKEFLESVEKAKIDVRALSKEKPQALYGTFERGQHLIRGGDWRSTNFIIEDVLNKIVLPMLYRPNHMKHVETNPKFVEAVFDKNTQGTKDFYYAKDEDIKKVIDSLKENPDETTEQYRLYKLEEWLKILSSHSNTLSDDFLNLWTKDISLSQAYKDRFAHQHCQVEFFNTDDLVYTEDVLPEHLFVHTKSQCNKIQAVTDSQEFFNSYIDVDTGFESKLQIDSTDLPDSPDRLSLERYLFSNVSNYTDEAKQNVEAIERELDGKQGFLAWLNFRRGQLERFSHFERTTPAPNTALISGSYGYSSQGFKENENSYIFNSSYWIEPAQVQYEIHYADGYDDILDTIQERNISEGYRSIYSFLDDSYLTISIPSLSGIKRSIFTSPPEGLPKEKYIYAFEVSNLKFRIQAFPRPGQFEAIVDRSPMPILFTGDVTVRDSEDNILTYKFYVPEPTEKEPKPNLQIDVELNGKKVEPWVYK